MRKQSQPPHKVPQTKQILVFATAACRIHADILIARLKQAGIPMDLISAFYRPQMRPNSAICWLGGTARGAMSSGETMLVSGLLRFALGHHHGAGQPLAHGLNSLGLAPGQAMALEETVLKNHTVLCIQAEDDHGLAVILRTLEDNAAENVLFGVTESTRRVPASQWGVTRLPLRAARQPEPGLCPAF
jgi:hypothetical protein